MLQLLLEQFKPEDIVSTNAIEISVGKCFIDIPTAHWYRAELDTDGKR